MDARSGVELAFPSTDRSRLRRLHERGSHERQAINAVLDAGLICHVGYVIDGQPFVTPTAYWRDGNTVYWHGSSASRMLRAVRRGVPACLTVTHLDGLVLARSGFHHSLNYRSAMLFGQAQPVEELEPKERALQAFVERLFPGRSDQIRASTVQEVKATTVLAMPIDEASAKLRSGPPKDDEGDYALDVWAGVVPVRQVLGAPVADPRLKPDLPIPAHVATYADGEPLDAVLARMAGA